MEKLPLYDTREIRVEGDVYLQINRIFRQPQPFEGVNKVFKEHSVEAVKRKLEQLVNSAMLYTGISADTTEFIRLIQNESDAVLEKFVSYYDMSYLNLGLYIELDKVFIRYAYTSDFVGRYSSPSEPSDARKLKAIIGIDLEEMIDRFNDSVSATEKINILKDLLNYTDCIVYLDNTCIDLSSPFDSFSSGWNNEFKMSKERLGNLAYSNQKTKFDITAPTRTMAQKNDLLAILMLYLQQQHTTHHTYFQTTHLLYLLKKHITDPRSIKFVQVSDNAKYYVKMHESKLSIEYRDDAAQQELYEFIAAQLKIPLESVEKCFKFFSVINFTFFMLELTGEVYVDIDYIPPAKNFARPYKKLLERELENVF